MARRVHFLPPLSAGAQLRPELRTQVSRVLRSHVGHVAAGGASWAASVELPDRSHAGAGRAAGASGDAASGVVLPAAVLGRHAGFAAALHGAGRLLGHELDHAVLSVALHQLLHARSVLQGVDVRLRQGEVSAHLGLVVGVVLGAVRYVVAQRDRCPVDARALRPLDVHFFASAEVVVEIASLGGHAQLLDGLYALVRALEGRGVVQVRGLGSQRHYVQSLHAQVRPVELEVQSTHVYSFLERNLCYYH